MLDAYSKPDANLSGHQNAITPDVILLPSKRSMSLEDQTNAQNLSARDQDGLQARITTLEKQLSTCQHALADIEERYRALFMNTLLGFAYHRIVLDAEQKPVDYIFLEVMMPLKRLPASNATTLCISGLLKCFPALSDPPLTGLAIMAMWR